MTNLINKKVIVRSYGAGVFYGILKDHQDKMVELENVRRLWYWSGAASLSQLAVEGVKHANNCKFTMIVPLMQITQVIEIIPCTEAAINNIESVPVWKN